MARQTRPIHLGSILPLLAFIWVERLHKGLNPENTIPFVLHQCPKGSVFLSEDDKLWYSPEEGYNGELIRLSRPRGLGDDAILQFRNEKLWMSIDDLFGNTYFRRTWIQQEVAVPNAVYVTCGQDQVPFDIFQCCIRRTQFVAVYAI
ncbi:hypothetical protein K469DRAFT_683253 [Zopfia rhizophila CBS 207.26]|uniref:Heterokaryon incompatibility domain-containing protein n=1 Tax=Zopfia rhizophila CBS 207.26 TaxID=1314779 RepID=A0A6A6EH36_9PEZI|nr:hypothetical protein K469DRAFT_683253 [Zopfia rhizophila CBS 207.26]